MQLQKSVKNYSNHVKHWCRIKSIKISFKLHVSVMTFQVVQLDCNCQILQLFVLCPDFKFWWNKNQSNVLFECVKEWMHFLQKSATFTTILRQSEVCKDTSSFKTKYFSNKLCLQYWTTKKLQQFFLLFSPP